MTWLLALILLPLAGALIVTGLRTHDRGAMAAALSVSLVELLLVIPLWLSYEPDGDRIQQATSMKWIPALGTRISFGIDGIALLMIAATALLVPIVMATLASTDKLPEGRVGGFLSLMLVQEALTVAVFAATDVFLFYVLFEVMLVPMYFLIGFYGGPRRQYAAVKFFLYSFLGGMIMLASAIGAYVLAADEIGSGTFDWATLVSVVSDAPLHTQVWLFLGFFVAFAIKAPLVPFHTWLPDAAGQAPVAVTVLLVGVLDKVGTFGFLRYSLPMFPDASTQLAPLVLVLAVVGVLYGSILAVGQQDMKRFVAYVSIAHFGFIALGIFAFSSQATVGSATYMLNHSLATGMLILVIGMIATRGGSTRISDYGGMFALTPVLGGMLLVAGLSTFSLPGTNAFISEFLVLLGAFDTEPVYAVIAVFGLVLAAAYVLWLYQRIMTGPLRGAALTGVDGEDDAVGPVGSGSSGSADLREDSGEEGRAAGGDAAGGVATVAAPEARTKKRIPDLSFREIAALAPLIVLIVGLGLYPSPVLETVTPSVETTLSAVQEG